MSTESSDATGVANRSADLPRTQNSKTYKIEEKTPEGWKSIWRVVDFKKTAYEQLEKAEIGSGRYDDDKTYRLIETLTNEDGGDKVLREVAK